MLKGFFCDLFNGWSLTLHKLSVQVEAINLVAIIPLLLQAADGGHLSAQNVLLIMGIVSVVKFLASNITQKSVGSYDKTTQGVYDLATQTVTDKVTP